MAGDAVVVNRQRLCDSLAAMFPSLKPQIINDTVARATSTEQAVDFLVGLCAGEQSAELRSAPRQSRSSQKQLAHERTCPKHCSRSSTESEALASAKQRAAATAAHTSNYGPSSLSPLSYSTQSRANDQQALSARRELLQQPSAVKFKKGFFSSGPRLSLGS